MGQLAHLEIGWLGQRRTEATGPLWSGEAPFGGRGGRWGGRDGRTWRPACALASIGWWKAVSEGEGRAEGAAGWSRHGWCGARWLQRGARCLGMLWVSVLVSELGGREEGGRGAPRCDGQRWGVYTLYRYLLVQSSDFRFHFGKNTGLQVKRNTRNRPRKPSGSRSWRATAPRPVDLNVLYEYTCNKSWRLVAFPPRTKA